MAQLKFKDSVSAKIRIETAIQNGKKSISIEGNKIALPTPQSAGTFVQQTAYARQWADNYIKGSKK